MRTPLLKHTHIVKLGRLLNMMYKPSEIAEELGLSPDTIYRSYLPAGLPHTRDPHGGIWIHGPAFVAWARETVSKRKAKRQGLLPGHAWCMKCNAAVPLVDPRVVYSARYMEILQANCPTCDGLVNRAQSRKAGTT